MSQHISGDIGQHIRQDFGEFITISNIRVRKALVQSYMAHVDAQTRKIVGVKVLIAGGWLVGDFDEEGALKELARLDWIYKDAK